MTVQLIHGDCVEAMRQLATTGVKVDAVVCDPPYHLQSIVDRFGGKNAAPAKFGTDGAFARQSKGFMGHTWDNGIAARLQTWIPAWNLLKPGGYLLAFGGTRTWHRMTCAIEDAGFIIHPMIIWIFGQGMPHGHKVEDPEWVGWYYGTQSLKPAFEPICMAQKPMTGRTGTANVLEFGTGAINIGGCRVPYETVNGGNLALNPHLRTHINGGNGGNIFPHESARRVVIPDPKGRYPSNLIHDGSDEVIASFPDAPGQLAKTRCDATPKTNAIYGKMNHDPVQHAPRGDSGSAARYFYCAKATKKDRAGSKHPTIKPLALMRYLCRLVTPPGGLLLDPFAGSGTTLQAAREEGFRSIGIEQEAEYVADIVRRLSAA